MPTTKTILAAMVAATLWSQTAAPPEVGGGAPSDFVKSRFSAAFGRNQFYLLVAPTPVADVQKLGTSGLVQLFYDTTKTANVRYGLVKADANASIMVSDAGQVTGGDVYQVWSSMWAYVATVNGTSATAPANVNTSGYPTMDTASCGPVGEATCLYQLFDKKYALFVYSKALSPTLGATFAVRDPFYTAWLGQGGVGGMGGAKSGEQAVVSGVSAAAGLWQQYQAGGIVSVTAGILNGRVTVVREPVYSAYVANGGPAGFLGYPLGEVRVQTNGKLRQAFEGGSVEYALGGEAGLLLPVAEVDIPGTTSPMKMNLGETAALAARLFAANNVELAGRSVAWTTSNKSAVTLEPAGQTVTLKAVGGGTAVIQATSEGKTSRAVTVYVSAPCCQVGEGAPKPAVAQAIADAINRNKLQVKLPASGPVRRLGPGFVQEFVDAATGAKYLIAVPEAVSTAYLVRGAVLARYEELGGPAGAMGYPAGEASAGGRQMFAGGSALAGAPVRVVAGAILAKWASMGYETGAAGLPAGEAAGFTTFTASTGQAQEFAGGVIYGGLAGAQAAKGCFVGAPLLAKYVEMEGPAGVLGMAVHDAVVVDMVRQQEFEGGWLELAPGDGEVRVRLKERVPFVTATPNPVTAGGRVRLAVGGFAAGAALRVSMTSQADFTVTAERGSYAWETMVAAGAASTVVVVKAVSAAGEKAEGSFRIRSLVEAEPKLVKLAGDGQTGVPGAVLGERIRVVLRDSAGNAVPGVPVVFTASPGAAVERADGETDESGEASAAFRLPAGEMVALATASAARQVVTFQAKSAASSLRNFPKMKQNLDVPLGNGRATIAERGALLAGLANMIRYHQDRAELPAPNGLAEVAGLNAFLTNSCVARASGGENLCDGFLTPGGEEQLVNVWRVPAFVGGGAEIEAGAGLETVRDWVAAGWPVLVSLRMTAEGAAAGMHHVVATGVMASGAIESFDAGSYFGRGSVDEYLREFSVGGRVWKGEVASVVRLALKPAATAGFVVRSAGALAVSGPAGACGVVLDWQDKAATATSGEARRYVQAGCDGAAARYQAVTAGLAAVELTGLAAPVAESRAEGVKTYGIGEGPGWRVQAQRLTLDAGVVNAANGMPEIGPGSLVALTGTGLWGDGMEVAALVGGLKAAVVEPGPFRINVAIPPESYAGTRVVSLESALGYVELPLELDEAAPAIFEGAGGPVVRNESGAMATAMKPVVRGRPMRVYATGLGLVAGGQAERAVTVSVGGVDVKPEAVANVVGMAGVYEVTVVVPAGTAPAAGVAVALKQAGRESKTVWIAVE